MCCLRQCCDGEVQAGFCSSGSLPLLPRGLDSWITRLLRLRVWAPAASASSLWVAFLLCANRLGRQSRQLTPTALGSGRSSLVHKVHAIAHSARLSAADWRYTCRMMNETLSWTGDLGVESGMPGFKGNVCRLFGDWALQEAFPQDFERASEQELGSEFDFALPAEAAEGNGIARLQRLKEFNLDFTRSIYIPGLLHIMHNLTEGLDRAMSWWKEFVSRLTHVCRLLGRKWKRARLIATCFVDAPWNAFVALYGSLDGSVYQGRWGAVLHAVTELLPLEVSLRGAWCKAKFALNAQGAGRDASGGSKQLDVDVVDEAIQSTRFWAYLHMIKRIGDTIEHIMFLVRVLPLSWSR